MFYQIIERAPAMLIKVICISLLLISHVSNIYSQETTWFWQNPYPQGHNINGVKFIDQNTGIACGDYGTILRTSDGGLTWKVSYLSEINNLSEIFFVNQLTGFIFPGYTTGNVFTYNIQKTTDGGLSWAPRNTGELIRYVTGVNFINENTGFACGMFQTSGGKVIKTTDSGESWSTILTNTTGFYDISFPDENNGYLLGNNSSMLRTTNSGVNWFEVTRITVNSAVSIFFTDSVTGYGIGGYPGFYKTTNGGMNWFSLGTSSGIQIYFFDAERGYILGSSGGVRLTTNGGIDWYSFSSGTYIEAKSLNFGNENTGYIVGNNGRILKTNNGGFIWTLVSNSVSNSSLFDVDFINSSTGFIFGANGTILKTTNSGNNWTSSQLLSSWDLGRAEFLNENTGYLCADSIVWKSRLYKTTNSGNVWNSVFYITSNNITSEFFTDP